MEKTHLALSGQISTHNVMVYQSEDVTPTFAAHSPPFFHDRDESLFITEKR
jgi:hypothetical protein